MVMIENKKSYGSPRSFGYKKKFSGISVGVQTHSQLPPAKSPSRTISTKGQKLTPSSPSVREVRGLRNPIRLSDGIYFLEVQTWVPWRIMGGP